ncbi:MAG: BatA domain-containing protein [Polyangiales bacterium]
MGFGIPLALLGALAVAAPVVIHLLRQRDVPVFRLPTVALLSRATAESRRKLRLRDRWLLFLRALAILAFALGAAGPWIASTRAFDDGRRASLALVIDDSMSMARTEGGDALLSLAVARAVDQLDALPPDSEASLVLAGAPARLAVPRTRELARVRRALVALDPESARGTALLEGVELARTSLSGAAHQRRIVVFSDFAAHGRLTELPPTRGIEWALETLGPVAPANAAVVEANAAPDPTTPGRLALEVVVRGAPGPHAIEVHHDDVLLGRTEVTIEADDAATVGTARVSMHVTEPPIPDAIVRIVADDDLALDDARGLLLEPGAAARVLLVDGEPHAARDRDEVGYLTRALEAAPHDDGGIAFRVVDVDSLPAASLDELDVVVLANVANLRASERERLRRFVAAGGGLLVALGERVDARTLRAELPWLPATPLGPRALPPGTTMRTVARDLPPIDAGARRILALEPALGSEVAVESAGSEEGAALLVRGSEGEGRVAMLALPLDDAWSELPFAPGYVPFVSELLRGLARGRRAPSAVLSAGAVVPIPERSVVRAPDGTTYEPAEGTFADTARPGVYRVLEDGEVTSSFVIAPPASESDLTPGVAPDVGNAENQARSARRTRRRPIDPWFFLLGGLALLGEAWLRVRR